MGLTPSLTCQIRALTIVPTHSFLNAHWYLDKFGMTGSTAQLVNGVFLM